MPNTVTKILYLFLISMLPVVELRGAIPIGAAMEIEWYINLWISVIGNLIPVPFILLFIRRIVTWMEQNRHFPWFVHFLEEKVRKNAAKVLKYANWGILFFVAIPLPGTGAWTGALIAAFLDIRMKHALLSIAGGVLFAGLIMTAAAYGVVGFLKFLMF